MNKHVISQKLENKKKVKRYQCKLLTQEILRSGGCPNFWVLSNREKHIRAIVEDVPGSHT